MFCESRFNAEEADIQAKRNEYRQYIQTHISNVMKAFEEFGEQVCEAIGADYDKVKALVLIHDESKFSEIEFEPYRQKFYPTDAEKDVMMDANEYDKAWLHHLNNNPHHPECWIIPEEGGNKCVDMPVEYIAEMLFDWESFYYLGRGNSNSFYYEKDNKNGLLNPNTRYLVEKGLAVMKRG